jgi:hypothetical protein
MPNLINLNLYFERIIINEMNTISETNCDIDYNFKIIVKGMEYRKFQYRLIKA